MIDYELFELRTMDKDDQPTKIRRTLDNIRKRPNGHNRHDPVECKDGLR